jgi:hypothetical protein
MFNSMSGSGAGSKQYDYDSDSESSCEKEGGCADCANHGAIGGAILGIQDGTVLGGPKVKENKRRELVTKSSLGGPLRAPTLEKLVNTIDEAFTNPTPAQQAQAKQAQQQSPAVAGAPVGPAQIGSGALGLTYPYSFGTNMPPTPYYIPDRRARLTSAIQPPEGSMYRAGRFVSVRDNGDFGSRIAYKRGRPPSPESVGSGGMCNDVSQPSDNPAVTAIQQHQGIGRGDGKPNNSNLLTHSPFKSDGQDQVYRFRVIYAKCMDNATKCKDPRKREGFLNLAARAKSVVDAYDGEAKKEGGIIGLVATGARLAARAAVKAAQIAAKNAARMAKAAAKSGKAAAKQAAKQAKNVAKESAKKAKEVAKQATRRGKETAKLTKQQGRQAAKEAKEVAKQGKQAARQGKTAARQSAKEAKDVARQGKNAARQAKQAARTQKLSTVEKVGKYAKTAQNVFDAANAAHGLYQNVTGRTGAEEEELPEGYDNWDEYYQDHPDEHPDAEEEEPEDEDEEEVDEEEEEEVEIPQNEPEDDGQNAQFEDLKKQFAKSQKAQQQAQPGVQGGPSWLKEKRELTEQPQMKPVGQVKGYNIYSEHPEEDFIKYYEDEFGDYEGMDIYGIIEDLEAQGLEGEDIQQLLSQSQGALKAAASKGVSQSLLTDFQPNTDVGNKNRNTSCMDAYNNVADAKETVQRETRPVRKNNTYFGTQVGMGIPPPPMDNVKNLKKRAENLEKTDGLAEESLNMYKQVIGDKKKYVEEQRKKLGKDKKEEPKKKGGFFKQTVRATRGEQKVMKPQAQMNASTMSGFGKPTKAPKKAKKEKVVPEAQMNGSDMSGMGSGASPDSNRVAKAPKEKKSRKGQGSGKPNKRAEIVRKVMKEKGMSMIEASKYVKANGLY